MEELTGDVEPYHHAHYSAPFSQRELHSLYLDQAMAPSDVEKKRILDAAGMTVEDLGEHFDTSCSDIAHDG
ncbi:hypothetical protein ACFW1F_26755 [Streptomyces bungoensis]|uniref:hypothetical protein n=1 Tax=Streptomyces bungoensis TaxID=285568 RepID=UPI00342800F1